MIDNVTLKNYQLYTSISYIISLEQIIQYDMHGEIGVKVILVLHMHFLIIMSFPSDMLRPKSLDKGYINIIYDRLMI